MTRLSPVSPSRSERVEVEMERSSYIDWPGVFVGVIVASALSWLLLTFGSAIGLASVSAYSSNQDTAATFTLTAAAWFAITQIYAIAMGGYIAARLRPRVSVAESDEVAFRDGVTGLTVWGLAIIIGLVLAAMITSGAVRATANVAGAAASTASRAVDPAYTVDRLLRPANTGQPGSAEQPQLDQGTRDQVGRILANALVTGDLPQGDRDYLGQLIASRTGVAPEEAQRRLTETYDQAKATALEAAESARKATAMAGFWVVFIMFTAGLATWWAGTVGGNHRDDGV
jgi:hypothetical protein